MVQASTAKLPLPYCIRMQYALYSCILHTDLLHTAYYVCTAKAYIAIFCLYKVMLLVYKNKRCIKFQGCTFPIRLAAAALTEAYLFKAIKRAPVACQFREFSFLQKHYHLIISNINNMASQTPATTSESSRLTSQTIDSEIQSNSESETSKTPSQTTASNPRKRKRQTQRNAVWTLARKPIEGLESIRQFSGGVNKRI